MWFHQQADGVGVHDRKQTYQGKVTTCDKSIPKWNSGAKVTNTVYSRGSNCNREYLKNAIHQKGHAMIGMFASEPQVKDYKSGVLETCRYVFYVAFKCLSLPDKPEYVSAMVTEPTMLFWL